MTAMHRFAKHNVEEAGSRYPQGLGQSAHRVHCSRPQTNDQVTGADQRQSFLLGNRAMGYRTQDLRIEPGVASQLLRIHLVALPIAVRDRPQLADVRHDHLMAQFLQLFADPDRMRSSLHRYACAGHSRKPLLDSLRCRSEAAAIYDFIVFLESTVMAPEISEVDADRLGDPWAVSVGLPQ